MKKKIFVFLFDGFSDWEIAYLTPEIHKHQLFDLIYFSKDENTVSSMGGLEIKPNATLYELKIDELDMLVLPGGTTWEERGNPEIIELTKEIFRKGKPIAAICAATYFLGQQGLLDDLKHTSNDLIYLKKVAQEYRGEKNYIKSFAVTDGNIITASGIAPIEFAREIFMTIGLFDNNGIEKWFQMFKNGIWD